MRVHPLSSGQLPESAAHVRQGIGGNEILSAIMLRVQELDRLYGPLTYAGSTHQALAVEALALRKLIDGPTDWVAVHKLYVTVGAIMVRSMRDQQIPTLTTAELKTKPV